MTTKIKSIAILLRLLIIYIYTNFIKIKIYHFSLQKLKKILNYLLNFFLFSLKILYINILLFFLNLLLKELEKICNKLNNIKY